MKNFKKIMSHTNAILDLNKNLERISFVNSIIKDFYIPIKKVTTPINGEAIDIDGVAINRRFIHLDENCSVSLSGTIPEHEKWGIISLSPELKLEVINDSEKAFGLKASWNNGKAIWCFNSMEDRDAYLEVVIEIHKEITKSVN